MFFIILFCFCFIPDIAQCGLKSGARIMEYPISARTLGMGEAFAGLADDVNTIQYNPAGLNLIPGNQLGVSCQKGLYDTFYSNLIFAMPIGQEAGLGLSAAYLDGGQLEVNEVDGTSSQVKAQQDILVGVSGGIRILNENMVGLNVKILSSTLAQESKALNVAFDAGVLYALLPELRLGISLLNLGPNIKYQSASDPLPTTMLAGLGYHEQLSPEQELRMALDVRKPLDLDFQIHAGAEYIYNRFYYLRVGYKYGHDLDSVTAGVGLEWSLFRLDYAIGMMGELGLEHYVSLFFSL